MRVDCNYRNDKQDFLFINVTLPLVFTDTVRFHPMHFPTFTQYCNDLPLTYLFLALLRLLLSLLTQYVATPSIMAILRVMTATIVTWPAVVSANAATELIEAPVRADAEIKQYLLIKIKLDQGRISP